jgi:anti-anti-sigma factor
MQIVEARTAGVDVLAPRGRIDSTTATRLDERLAPLVAAARPRVVVDFSGVDYISSAGLRIMLLAARRVEETGGHLALCGMGDAVRQVFYLAGFLPLFFICATRDEAVTSIAP